MEGTGNAVHALDDPRTWDQDLATRDRVDPSGGDGGDTVPVGTLAKGGDIRLAACNEDMVRIGAKDGLAADLREFRAIAEDVQAAGVAKDVVRIGAGPDGAEAGAAGSAGLELNPYRCLRCEVFG